MLAIRILKKDLDLERRNLKLKAVFTSDYETLMSETGFHAYRNMAVTSMLMHAFMIHVLANKMSNVKQ